MKPCPNCGILNDDNWPLKRKGQIIDGGCQGCWEADCDRAWWRRVQEVMKEEQ